MLYPLSYEGGRRNTSGDRRIVRQNGPAMADPLNTVAARLAARLRHRRRSFLSTRPPTRSCGRRSTPTPRPTGRCRWPRSSVATLARWPTRCSTPTRSPAWASHVEVAGPGFINITFDETFLAHELAAVSDDDRLGVHSARASRDGRRRLLGAQRRQGDARRPPAQHRDRRRPGAHAHVRRPPGRPREPHRRLGDAVRHADRAPASTSARRRRPMRSSLGELDAFYKEARAKFDNDDDVQATGAPAGRAAAGRRRRDAAPVAAARRRCRRATSTRCTTSSACSSPTPTWRPRAGTSRCSARCSSGCRRPACSPRATAPRWCSPRVHQPRR